MKFEHLVKLSIIFSLVPALYIALFPGRIVLITILCLYPLVLLSLLQKLKYNINSNDGDFIIKSFSFYGLIVFFRGILDASSYQDWTTLISSGVATFIFIPFSIYFGITIKSLIIALRSFLIFGFPVCGFLFFTTDDPGPFGFTHLISPLYLFILISPYFNKRLTLLIIVLSVISFFYDMSIRSNLINILVAFLISLTSLFRYKIGILRIFKILREILIFAPIIFLILGVTGIFNIFTIGNQFDNLVIEDNNGNTQEVLIDSRTEIYDDVLSELSNQNALIFGLGASGKTKTHLEDTQNGDFDILYKEGRRGTESGMLNYIQYGGFLGGFLYFLLFIKSSYLAIYRSNSWLVATIGLWVAFKGFFSFIEDSLFFSVSSIFIFVPIGICFNKELRKKSDSEIMELFKMILSKKKYNIVHSPISNKILFQ